MGGNKVIESIFWLCIVFFIDPGGYIEVYNDGRLFGIHFQLFLGLLAYTLFFLANGQRIFNKLFMLQYLRFFFIWILYYWFVHGWLVTDVYSTPFSIIIKGQRMFWSLAIFIPIVFFARKDVSSFIQIFSLVNIVILILFIITSLTSLQLMPITTGAEGSRGFTDLARHMMFSFGIIYFGIPLAIASIYLNGWSKTNYLLIISASLVFVHHALLILRRELIGLLLFIIISTFLFNYLKRFHYYRAIYQVFSFRLILFISFLFFFLFLLSPDYLESTIMAFYDSIHAIFYGENLIGVEERRLSLTQNTGILKAIVDYPYFGTGFHPDWYTGDGGANEWMGSDFIFLSCIGMYGFVGLLIFVRFYFFCYRFIRDAIKLIRDYYYAHVIFLNRRTNSALLVAIATSLEIIRNMIEYPNWFLPIGATTASSTMFIYFGLLVGSYYYLVDSIPVGNSNVKE